MSSSGPTEQARWWYATGASREADLSRRVGIGYAIARRLLGYGARVVVHHHVPHDARQPWGADPGGIEAVLDGLRAAGPLAGDVAADLVEPDAPVRVVDAAVRLLGHLDVLVCNHARSNPDGGLGALDAGILDGHWAVDARSTILLAQEFAARHDGRPGGRIVLLTSARGSVRCRVRSPTLRPRARWPRSPPPSPTSSPTPASRSTP